MHGVLVVFGMARPEVMVIVPAEEGKDAHEQPVQGAGLEYRVVNQLMKPVDQEMPGVTMQQDKQCGDIPGPMNK